MIARLKIVWMFAGTKIFKTVTRKPLFFAFEISLVNSPIVSASI